MRGLWATGPRPRWLGGYREGRCRKPVLEKLARNRLVKMRKTSDGGDRCGV
ncbi:hypothetical protein Hanom_Chr15g01399991 [Helianthus anomalus]